MKKILLCLVSLCLIAGAICDASQGADNRNKYLMPIYRVSVERDLVYSEASGFWTSYPDTGEDFMTIYANKTEDLLRGRTNCPLTMDIYTPVRDRAESRPLLVFIHGGAFFNGDKATEPIVKWCEYFASLGYVVASINYRLGFIPTPHAIIEAAYRAYRDTQTAINFLMFRKEKYKIDPDRVFVAGSSAGGITALNMAFMKEKDWPWRGTTKYEANPWEGYHYKVIAVANLWGAVQDLKVLSNSDSAVISFHSRWDPVVPFAYDYPFRQLSYVKNILFDRMYGSSMIHEELKRLERPTELYAYDLDIHELYYDENHNISPRLEEMMRSTAEFFSKQMRNVIKLEKRNHQLPSFSIGPIG